MKFGILEIVFILVVIFIIFGAGKLPQIFGMFGKWKNDFTKEKSKGNEEDTVEVVKTSKTKKSKS